MFPFFFLSSPVKNISSNFFCVCVVCVLLTVCILYITRKKKAQKEGSDVLLLLQLLSRVLRSSLKRVYMCIYTHTLSLSLSKVKKLEKREKDQQFSGIKKKQHFVCILKQTPLGFKAQRNNFGEKQARNRGFDPRLSHPLSLQQQRLALFCK
jgi:hypothetical protein